MQLLWPQTANPPELAAGDAHVWAVLLALDASVESSLWNILAVDERTRAETFRFADPRRTFVVARGALRMLLGQYLGERPEEISFSFEGIAKPMLTGKYAAADLRFNVSHSGDLALIAVNRGSDVGVDVEQCRPVKQLEQLARRYFHPQETEAVLATAAATRNDAFLRCWTAKEAVLKACGTGLAGSLDLFHVPSAESFEGWIDLSAMPTPTKSSQCWLQRLAPCDEYVAAVAHIGSQRRTRCFALSM